MKPESITSQWYYNYVVARIQQLQNAEPDADELKSLTELREEYLSYVPMKQKNPCAG